MRVLNVLLGMLTAIVFGCKRDSAPAANAPGTTTVEVISDPSVVDAARKAWATRREQHLARLLANPDQVAHYDDEAMELLGEQRDRAISSFTVIRDDDGRPPSTRLSAVAALRCLDVNTPGDQVARLAGADAESRFSLMLRFQDLFPGKDPQVPEGVRRAIVRAIDDPEPRSYLLAAEKAARAGWAEAAEPIRARLAVGAEQPQRLRNALARLRPDRSIVEKLAADLGSENDRWGGGNAVRGLAEVVEHAPDPAVRKAATDALFHYLRSTPDKKWIDSNTWSAVDALSKLPAPENRRLLTALAGEAKWRSVREYAGQSIKKLDAPAPSTASTRPAEQHAPATQGRIDPAAVRVATLCVRHDLLTQAAADEAIQRLAGRAAGNEGDNAVGDGDGGRDASGDLVAFMAAARRQVSFDVETGMVPNRHDRLLLEFAAGSAGVFKPEAATEDYVPDKPNADTGKYTVQFVHAGRLYRFRPKDLGDWYDVGAVVTAINRALADAGVTDRFVQLAGGDQVTTYLFGPPDAVLAVGGELGVPLAGDPDAARKAGKAFEDRVIEDLQRRGQ